MGEVAALANAVLWAATSVILGGLAGRLSALRANAIQLTFGTLFYLILVPLAGGRALFAALTPARGLALAGTAVLTMGIGDSLYFTGIDRLGASRASPISVSSFPIVTLLLGSLLLGERLRWSVLAGAILIIAGILVLVLSSPRIAEEVPAPGSEGSAPMAGISEGDDAETRGPPVRQPVLARGARATDLQTRARGATLVLGATVAWSAATLWLRVAAAGLPAVAVTAVRIPSAAIFLVVACQNRGLLSLEGVGRRALLLLLAAGVIGTGIGSLTYIIAVQRTGAGLTAVLTSTSPLWVLPLATVFLHERPTAQVLLGAIIALAGIGLVLV